MKLQSTIPERLWIIIVAAALLLMILPRPELATASTVCAPPTQANTPALQITHVDTTKFPQVDVYIHGENLGAALDSIPLTIQEDSRTQEIIGNDYAPVGVQVALVSAVFQRDNNDPSHLNVSEAVRRLTNLGLLSPSTDWLAALGAVDRSNIGVLQAWNVDHIQVTESLVRHRPPDGGPQLALFDMVDMALDRFEQADIPSNLKRTLVLFSTGLDRHSARTLPDVVNRANSKGIVIHTVLVGQVSVPGQTNLQRLAANTGGQFRIMNVAGDLDSLWQTIAGARNQRILTYRSGQKRAWQITAIALLPNGSSVQAEKRFPSPPLKPAQIKIPQAISNTIVTEKESGVFSSDVTEELNLSLEFLWPDGYERTIAQVEYIIDNNTAQTQVTPPFSQLPIPLSLLETGNHTLRIRATDELGIAGESNPVLLRVNPVYAVASPGMLMLIGGGLLMGLGILFGGGFWWYRSKNNKEEQAVQPRLTGAQLTVIDKEAETNQIFTLKTGDNSIGRNIGNKIVVDNNRVSRKHCLIRYHEKSGYFLLIDTDSTGGTFVNGQPLKDGRQHILKDNDIIRLGNKKPVECQFHISRESGDSKQRSSDDIFLGF